MNKKIALLIFSIGIGAASAPAFAFSCISICNGRYQACLKDGIQTEERCIEMDMACQDACYSCAQEWHPGC